MKTLSGIALVLTVALTHDYEFLPLLSASAGGSTAYDDSTSLVDDLSGSVGLSASAARVSLIGLENEAKILSALP